jgi:hypothetical protein
MQPKSHSCASLAKRANYFGGPVTTEAPDLKKDRGLLRAATSGALQAGGLRLPDVLTSPALSKKPIDKQINRGDCDEQQ